MGGARGPRRARPRRGRVHRVRVRRRDPRAVPDDRVVRVPVALRGIRAAGPRGGPLRLARDHLEPGAAPRGARLGAGDVRSRRRRRAGGVDRARPDRHRVPVRAAREGRRRRAPPHVGSRRAPHAGRLRPRRGPAGPAPAAALVAAARGARGPVPARAVRCGALQPRRRRPAGPRLRPRLLRRRLRLGPRRHRPRAAVTPGPGRRPAPPACLGRGLVPGPLAGQDDRPRPLRRRRLHDRQQLVPSRHAGRRPAVSRHRVVPRRRSRRPVHHVCAPAARRRPAGGADAVPRAARPLRVARPGAHRLDGGPAVGGVRAVPALGPAPDRRAGGRQPDEHRHLAPGADAARARRRPGAAGAHRGDAVGRAEPAPGCAATSEHTARRW